MTYWLRFARNTAALTLSAALGQAITFLGILASARLYGPYEFGIYGIFAVAISICAFLASWRYELAIVTAESTEEAVDIAVLVVFAGIFAAVATALLLSVAPLLPEPLRLEPPTRSALLAVPISLLLTSLTLAGTNLCIRERRFVRLAIHQLTLPAATVASQLSLGTSVPTIGPLISGFVLGQVVGLAILSAPILAAVAQARRKPGLLRRLSKVGHVHRRHIAYTVPYSLLTQFYYQLPLILLNAFHTTQSVGFFSMAFRTTYTPIALFPASISQVFFPDMARDRQNLKQWESRLVAVLAALGILLAPAVACLLVLGPEFYSAILGANWATAGLFAQIMIMPNLGIGLATGYDRIFFILQRQRTALIVISGATAASFALMISTNWLTGSAIALTASWAFGHFLLAAVWITTIYRIAGFSLRALLCRSSLVALAVITISLEIFLISGYAATMPSVWFFSPFLLGIYALMLWRAVKEFRRSIQQAALSQ